MPSNGMPARRRKLVGSDARGEAFGERGLDQVEIAAPGCVRRGSPRPAGRCGVCHCAARRGGWLWPAPAVVVVIVIVVVVMVVVHQ